MNKQVKAYILPTEDKTNVAIMRSGNKLVFIKEPLDLNNGFQHIYITSDEEIKVGDPIYNTVGNTVGRMISKKPISEFNRNTHRKIIATSDRLNKYSTGMVQVPNVSQSFQKAFVESGGKEDWLIEYELKPIPEGVAMEYGKLLDANNPLNHKLKLDSDNCVILSAVEEKMYSLEEMKVLSKSAYDTGDKWRLWLDKIAVGFGEGKTTDEVYKKYGYTNWIKENL